MYVVVIHHMNDADLINNAKFFLFCSMMDESDFAPLHGESA